MSSELIEGLARYSSDPLGFVLWAFPWGEPGELENASGPEPWQRKFLIELGSGVITCEEAVRLARTSGHGIGKSALVSWIILWAISTFEDTKGVVTANTETQLKTKTWVELAKWYRLFIGRELFNMTATALFASDPEHQRTWRIDMVPWSERNTEAFAGLHNKGKRIILIYDEASAIPDVIWEVSEGALTDEDTQIIWSVFGNPTRNKGRFRECFYGGKFAHRWNSAAVDSRDVSITNKEQIERWIEDYGEDHDFVRVRVRGVFPRVDATSFIGYEIAKAATEREVEPQIAFPVVVGVDVARFGDDCSVIYFRRGRDGKTIAPRVYRGIDTMTLATHVMVEASRVGASFIFVDEGGVGGGVVDRLQQLRVPVVGINFANKPDNINHETGVKYANKRSEIWGGMREWLKKGTIPEVVAGIEHSFIDELVAPNYGMNKRDEIQLEGKNEMRRRNVQSPNVADALALTFALPDYEPKDQRGGFEERPPQYDDYNPYETERICS